MNTTSAGSIENMFNILAFTGRRYSGKSKMASLVVEMEPQFTKIGFADIAKRQFADMAGLEVQELSMGSTKEKYRKDFVAFVEGRKAKDPSYWARRLFESLELYESTNFVIDDLRFIEELELVIKNKGIVYKVQASPEVRKVRGWKPDDFIDNHYSETELDISSYTFYELTGGGGVFNNETDSDAKLRGQVFKILNSHFR